MKRKLLISALAALTVATGIVMADVTPSGVVATALDPSCTGTAPGVKVGSSVTSGSAAQSGTAGYAVTSDMANTSLDYEANAFATGMNQDVSTAGTPSFAGLTTGYINSSYFFVAPDGSANFGEVTWDSDGNISTNGNLTAANFIGNGSTLTGVLTSMPNEMSFDTDTITSDGSGKITCAAFSIGPYGVAFIDQYGNAGFNNLAASTFTGDGSDLTNLRSNDAYADGTIVPTGYITLYDSTGTKYQIPAVVSP